MAAGGGRPRCCVVILISVEPPTRSELNGESILGLGETRDFASDIRGEKSWMVLPPNSTLAGCEMVSDIALIRGVACDQAMHVCVQVCARGRGERQRSELGSYILSERVDQRATCHDQLSRQLNWCCTVHFGDVGAVCMSITVCGTLIRWKVKAANGNDTRLDGGISCIGN